MSFTDAQRRDLYPFESHWLDRGGARLHYLDEGSGEPVVMVHGNPSWSLYYRELAKALRPSFRVIVPDHIGCGLSDKPADKDYAYTLESRVADLEALLDSVDVKSGITLVVHDWGGMIGFAYATRHPERIKRLVVLNTAAFRLPPGKPLPWALKLCRDSGLGAALVLGANAFSAAASHVGCKVHPMSAALRAAYQAPYDSPANRIATLRFVQDIPLVPGDRAWDLVAQTEDGLEALSHVPMLIGWGLRDFVFDRHFLAEWRRRFPAATVHAWEDAGHYVLEDVPDRLIPLIQAFLDAPVPAVAAP